ncbi:MAG: hypothetical protein FWD16_06355 [Clostridia bacterium]|nr:hypothetical protein [Clostridia bacterium]
MYVLTALNKEQNPANIKWQPEELAALKKLRALLEKNRTYIKRGDFESICRQYPNIHAEKILKICHEHGIIFLFNNLIMHPAWFAEGVNGILNPQGCNCDIKKEKTMKITGDGNTVIIQGSHSQATTGENSPVAGRNLDLSGGPPELPRAITDQKFEELQNFLSAFLSQPADAASIELMPEAMEELEAVALEDRRPTGWARFKTFIKKGSQAAVQAVTALADYANENPNAALWIRELLAKLIPTA